MKKYFRVGWVFCLCAVLSACGFALREPKTLSPQLNTLYIETATPNDPFVQTLIRVLIANQVTIVSNEKQAQSVLHILRIETNNTMMAGGGVNISGLYMASLVVQFSLMTEKGKLLIPPSMVQQSQSFMSNATQILSGNNTATQLTNQMQQSLAQSIVDQLAKVKDSGS